MKGICVFCKKEISQESKDQVLIGEKGAIGINNASDQRGDSIHVADKTLVHKSCRMNYVNIEKIKRHNSLKINLAPVAKRRARASTGIYDSKVDCLFCGKKVVINKRHSDFDEYSFVSTDTFVDKILQVCKSRNDEWAGIVRGQVEYFDGDLHAADCVYHNSCDINFRTLRDIPTQHKSAPGSNKKRKVGRPANSEQDEAFQMVCDYLETNDEEQLTITELSNKMNEYLHDSDSSSYGNQYLKSKLMSHYGDSIFVAEGEGQLDIVTFREQTSNILRDYFKLPNKDDEEAHKRAIIKTAAKLIKSDIKTAITPVRSEYPKATDLKLESTLEYVPGSLRYMLQHLFVGKDTRIKEASIGQSIIQAVRPRTVIAPLQLGLAAQMHHHFRSRFLIDSLSAMGFCVSYPEVQRFEENAASAVAPDILDGQTAMSDSMLLFAADNVDHNIVTLDGKNTFHGMGIIAAVTPGIQVSYKILRRKLCELNVTDQTTIPIKEYCFGKYARSTIKFKPLPLLNNCDHKIDLLWEMSLKFHIPTPNWQGMMYTLTSEYNHPGQSCVMFLPMINMYPGDRTCILSTLDYISNLAMTHNIPPVVTFDQPLFWKASEIVNEIGIDSPVKHIVLLLGSFHTLMNLLGAIGTLMENSGLQYLLESIYGENAVTHMITGKAVQRALRGHLLLDQCLTNQILSKIIEREPEFNTLIEELEKLYCQAKKGDTDVASVIKSDCMDKFVSTIISQKAKLSDNSKTSKLWLNYMRMLEIVRELIEADRTGSWQMHLHAVSDCLPIFAAAGHPNYLKSSYLYLQKMTDLEITNPEVFKKFIRGYHVIRRSNNFWAGLGCDLVIEQTLMRSLKSTGGLTRGSGMSDHQRAIWTMSSPVSSSYNYYMQEFCELQYSTSEQHKEATASRIVRDKDDLAKLNTILGLYNPFSSETTLRNIVTGVNADKDVNVHDLFSFGRNAVTKMENQLIFSYTHKRNNKVKTLASASVVKFHEDKTIDPALLFQRFLIVSQSGELSLDEVMKHELSPYPPSLFEGKYLLRKADKPALLEAIRNHATSVKDAVIQTIPKTEHYVLDGGSLLHRLKWTEGITYSSLADAYASFTTKLYGQATVVFDGYEGPSTKDNTHQRRKTSHVKNTVNITETTKFVGKKDDFLSNEKNKKSLIEMIAVRLRQNYCQVLIAEGDADLDIVKTAVNISTTKSTTLIGEDTDLLILLLYYGRLDNKNLFFRSDKGMPNVYNINVLKKLLGDNVCRDLMFVHAFTGCDTSSRIFGVGKKSVFQKVIKGESVLCTCSKIFCDKNSEQVAVESAGCKAMLALFNGTSFESLASLRCSYLCKKVANAKTFVTPERLPPTTSATKYHARRSYLQIMQWMGQSDNMDPINWGWNIQGDTLTPTMMDNTPAPEILLKLIHCNCSTGCNTRRCSCKKYGLDCTGVCGPCQDGSCENVKHSPILEENEDY